MITSVLSCSALAILLIENSFLSTLKTSVQIKIRWSKFEGYLSIAPVENIGQNAKNEDEEGAETERSR